MLDKKNQSLSIHFYSFYILVISLTSEFELVHSPFTIICSPQVVSNYTAQGNATKNGMDVKRPATSAREGDKAKANSSATNTTASACQSCDDILVGGPLMLGHYAVLAACTLTGIFVAHVQISTRLICSSCPALYWYMAVAVAANNDCHDKETKEPFKSSTKANIILFYCFFYMILGVALHSNWLPWT